MKTIQTTEDNTTGGRPLVFASSTMTAIGLWMAALGIFFQAISGAKGYPTIPPGIIILAVIGLLVYITARWRWSPLIGILLAGFISVGVFTTAGTGYRLSHPADIGPLLGTLIQLIGLVIALAAGIAAIVKNYKSST